MGYFVLLAREEGFEPPTRWLTATCSTTELLPIRDLTSILQVKLEARAGIEPAFTALQAAA